MKKNNYYESPVIKEFETKFEGIVCASGGGFPGLPGHGRTGNQDAGGDGDGDGNGNE